MLLVKNKLAIFSNVLRFVFLIFLLMNLIFDYLLKCKFIGALLVYDITKR